MTRLVFLLCQTVLLLLASSLVLPNVVYAGDYFDPCRTPFSLNVTDGEPDVWYTVVIEVEAFSLNADGKPYVSYAVLIEDNTTKANPVALHISRNGAGESMGVWATDIFMDNSATETIPKNDRPTSEATQTCDGNGNGTEVPPKPTHGSNLRRVLGPIFASTVLAFVVLLLVLIGACLYYCKRQSEQRAAIPIPESQTSVYGTSKSL